MVSCFNEISFGDMSGDDGYFEEIAKENLAEINGLREKLTVCNEMLETEKLSNVDMKARNEKLKDQVRNLSFDLRQKNEDIVILMERSRHAPQGIPGEVPPRMAHVDPAEISFKTKMLIRRIHEQHGEYLRTGNHEFIEGHISEVRDLFNLVLQQLSELNSKNKFVTRTLESLLKLDVKNLLFLSFKLS